jgi:HEAT repeat protein
MKRSLQLLAVVILAPVLAAHAQNPPSPPTPDVATLPPPVRALVDKLRGADLSQQLEGAYSLGQLGASAAPAIPFLLQVLQRNDGMIEVDSSLLRYFEAGTSFLFVHGQANTINPVQIVATASLGRIGRPAIAPMSVALQGADPTELYFAYLADALARIPDRAATAVLLDLLRGPSGPARSRAAGSLRWNSDPATLDALIAALEDPDAPVRRAAARALERRTGQSLGQDAARWRAWRAEQATRPPGA